MEPMEYPSYKVIAYYFNEDPDNPEGMMIATLAHNDWVAFINTQLSEDNKEWYTTPAMRAIHNFTGRGYFPRGITIVQGNGALIVIDETHANDERLLAHEYGHAIGYGHTSYPTTMNPVTNMRLYDAEGLIPKFRETFPALAKQIRENKPLQVPTAFLTGALLFFFLRG